ncbi:helix-loop-helix DNA-binding domain-containing protein [Dipodascopsis tothii]|uniref:helix-loop-helix DNA-binding domain-containing protein n=1 Tax=Dipodascopsis tothii TaxID=44089 RepID=UPI0034CD3113
MSYNSPPYIKPDPDAGFYGSSATVQNGFTVPAGNGNYGMADNGNGQDGLLSREMLTRGFSMFDDSSTAKSSMIPESDLLDFEGLGGSTMDMPGGYEGQGGMMAFKTEDDGSIPPMPVSGAGDLHGTTPYFSPSSHPTMPIMNSTSPFDDFAQVQQLQQHRAPQQHLQVGSAGGSVHAHHRGTSIDGHAKRFLYGNDYIPKQQSNLQSMSVPDSGSWNQGSFEQKFASPPLSSSVKGMGSSLPGSDVEKQQMMLLEKRRRRRESHNAVERRRRDNINEKIQELASLIPETMLLDQPFAAQAAMSGNADSVGDGSPSTPGLSTSASGVTGRDGKPNKGVILRRSVDYIRQLQVVLEEQRRRNEELERKVQQLESGDASTPSLPAQATDLSAQAASLLPQQRTPQRGKSREGDDFQQDLFDRTPDSNLDDDFYGDTVFQTSPQNINYNDTPRFRMDLT